MENKYLTREQMENMCNMDIDETRLGIITNIKDSQGYMFEEVLKENEDEIYVVGYYITKDGEFKGYTQNENINLILEHIQETGKVIAIDIEDVEKLIAELQIITDCNFELLNDYIVKQ